MEREPGEIEEVILKISDRHYEARALFDPKDKDGA